MVFQWAIKEVVWLDWDQVMWGCSGMRLQPSPSAPVLPTLRGPQCQSRQQSSEGQRASEPSPPLRQTLAPATNNKWWPFTNRYGTYTTNWPQHVHTYTCMYLGALPQMSMQLALPSGSPQISTHFERFDYTPSVDRTTSVLCGVYIWIVWVLMCFILK